MKILVIGDIVGRPGREATLKAIQEIKKSHRPDLVIANGENMAHGLGMTFKTFEEMRAGGVDFFTSGNHILRHKDIYPEMDRQNTRILRPANFPPGNPGRGFEVIAKNKKKLLVINLNGRVFMDYHYDCPFRAVESILHEHRRTHLDGILVDFHAEATSEKNAMKHFLDGQVSALWGTHTHVPTADAQITPKGMGYITDIGMVGVEDSVIGGEKEGILSSFLKQTNFQLGIPKGRCIFSGIMLEISGRTVCKSIELIQRRID